MAPQGAAAPRLGTTALDQTPSDSDYAGLAVATVFNIRSKYVK